MKKPGSHAKAITTVIATVILLAITLIAALALLGFVTADFVFTNTARVTVTLSSLSASNLTASSPSAPTATCATTAGSGSFIQLTNSGTATVGIASFSLTEGGATTTYAMAGCGNANPATVGASLYVQLTGEVAPPAVEGTPYLGNVALQNGAVIPVAGTFST